MGDEREFKIKISGDATGLVSAAQQSGQALGETANAAQKGAKANEDLAASTDKAEISHRNLRFGLRMLGPAFAEAGHLAVAAFANPVTAAFIAVAFAVSKVTEAFKAATEAIEEAAGAEIALWESARDRAREAETSARAYAEALKKIGTNVDELKEKEAQETAVLEANLAARRGIMAAQEGAELAMAKGDPIQTAAIQERYGQKRSAADIAEQESRIRLGQSQLAEEQRIQAAARQAFASAEAAKERGAAGGDDAVRARMFLESHKGDVTKAQVNLDELNARSGGMTAADYRGQAARSSDLEQVQLSTERAEALEKATKALADAKAAEDTAKAAILAHENAASGLARAEEEAKGALEKATKAVTDHAAKIATEQAVLGIGRTAAGEVGQIQIQSELEQAGLKPRSRAGATILGNINAEEALAHGETLSQNQQSGIQRLTESLRATGNNQQQINTILAEMKDLHVDHTQKLHDVLQALKILKQNAASSRSH